MIKTNYNVWSYSGFSFKLCVFKLSGYTGSKLLITDIKKGNSISMAIAIFSGRLANA